MSMFGIGGVVAAIAFDVNDKTVSLSAFAQKLVNSKTAAFLHSFGIRNNAVYKTSAYPI